MSTLSLAPDGEVGPAGIHVSRHDGRLRIRANVVSAAPVLVRSFCAGLRDGEGRLIFWEGQQFVTRAGVSHPLVLEQVAGDDLLAAARSIELSVDYVQESKGPLFVAALGPPGEAGQIPVTIGKRGTLPGVELLGVSAWFDDWLVSQPGIIVLVEVEAPHVRATPSVELDGRVRARGGKVLDKRKAHFKGPGGGRTVHELAFQFQGDAADLEVNAAVKTSGSARLGPVPLGGV